MESGSLAEAAAQALQLTGWRIRPVDAAGHRYWLKRVEDLPLRMRLQKGNPRRAFEAERRALHVLGGAGLPVVPMVAEGADWFALTDGGPTLASLVTKGKLPADELAVVFAAAGKALARLHLAGFSHGRPVLRDICWDGRDARFIDLERFRDRRASGMAQAVDLVILVQGWFIAVPEARAELGIMLRAYVALAGRGNLVRARQIARALGWLAPLSRLLGAMGVRSRDWRAVPLTLGHLRTLEV